MPQATHAALFSIVIPFYNEAGNVTPLFRTITESCRGFHYEVVAVNDGSSDDTSQELKSVAQNFPHIRVLTLKRNFGQTAALAAGIDHAKGNIIIAMDGDGQNDPADIPRLLEKMDEGYNLVSGWTKNPQALLLTPRIPYYLTT